ncbi:MAG: HAD-IIB family hydrolase [Ruminococcaceae bacterium]|nr:HAD-IIB family hydrolase [Oscillospiraceae bacterium]
MGYYDGYLILSDIDGTLTIRGGKISPENLSAIEHFQKEGGKFALATGRNPDYLDGFPFKSNAPIITVNGTLLTTPEGETLLSLPMEEDFHDVIDYMMANYPEIRRVYRRGSIASYEWVRGEDMEYASKLLTGEPCYKFVIVCDTENDALRLMDDMVRRFGDRYEYDRSWPIGLEMHRKHSGKDVCLQHLRKILPDVHTIIAAGDYENDIPMLRAADIGCAVGNALPSVKEAADRVIVTNEEHAIAYIINELIPSLK